ncbi:MAG: cell division protein ZapA [Bacteroidota bacterium]
MEELTISVNIADRIYKLTVKKEEEEIIRKATQLISNAVKNYSDMYSYKDKQDLLSMVVLQFATNALINENKNRFIEEQLESKLTEIDNILTLDNK